ncbi:phenazine biosynthesis protein, PhzF family [Ancylostoma ceylanicum]|uniref:Phenazine biosynthesis protein, PhzF family n=1 Tax=Ancylostoma ceylanicum TaxID=53326 RepID=A0A0D6LKZ4_9BILA|nr:phenazine biosynthesis protein, PhzF family [Ancylostoma ceylanicum]
MQVQVTASWDPLGCDMVEKHPTYIVDAFTSERFAGNQAAVCLIPRVLRDEEYRKIAAEFNLSETAFPIPTNGDFKTASSFTLRWFTPTTEVPLCGHATLATSHVLFNEIGSNCQLLWREWATDHLFDAPSHINDLIDCIIPSSINVESVAYASEAKKLIIVVDKQTTNFELSEITTKNCNKMKALDPDGDFVRGVLVTLAPANAKIQGFTDCEDEPYDYVCRYFAPWVGINEDPATGSAQCALAPFWAAVLGKPVLYAFQSYPNRGAQFRLQLRDSNRLALLGKSVTVLQGQLFLNEAVFY